MDCKAKLIYVTCPNEDMARDISAKLLQERLIACTNLLPGMESTYWWEGKITMSRECVLILKTTEALVERVKARVETLHSYQAPCILILPIEDGSKDYLRWLEGSLL
jgi:periplasmic divalent cation tolerance protein